MPSGALVPGAVCVSHCHSLSISTGALTGGSCPRWLLLLTCMSCCAVYMTKEPSGDLGGSADLAVICVGWNTSICPLLTWPTGVCCSQWGMHGFQDGALVNGCHPHHVLQHGQCGITASKHAAALARLL